MRKCSQYFTFATIGALVVGTAIAQVAPAEPSFEPDGAVQIPSFRLPPSPFMSEEAVALQKSLHVRRHLHRRIISVLLNLCAKARRQSLPLALPK
jgi:hypothetical protein